MLNLNTHPDTERILGRKAFVPRISEDAFQGERIMITGGLGSIGLAFHDMLDRLAVDCVLVDRDEMDVTDSRVVKLVMCTLKPTLILHLAGAKHAPEGELDPMEALRVNALGTRNVIKHAPEGAKLVTASTCKACDPETAYGATKLVAERLTLNAGHSVARFHNVVETSGNVFELWRDLDESAPLPVAAACERHFISIGEAVGLLAFTALWPESGRFIAEPGRRQSMQEIARSVYPFRDVELISPRRGDRLREPLKAACETTHVIPGVDGYLQVSSPYDPQVTA